ncbi:MAG: polysaccharide deacetylase family protein [Spirochaetes bacterium]|nr:polysaccharide deacetylase family protein [Spirochaetota bacterium]
MKRTAYLTIDDAPQTDFLTKIGFLKSAEIPAVFYCTGENLERRIDDAVFALNSGFIIGNHSFSHRHFSTLSVNEAFEEIEKTDEIINKIYKKADKDIVRTFRFPFGDKGWGDNPVEVTPTAEQVKLYESIQSFLSEKGYSQPDFPYLNNRLYLENGLLDDVDVFWTYDCREWAYDGTDEMKDQIFNRIDIDDPDNWFGLNSGTSAEIILIHDHDETSFIFEDLIRKIQNKGFEFKLPVFN